MPGEMNLAKMLASLSVTRRAGSFAIVSLDEPVALGNGVEAVLSEAEGITVVATVEAAERNGWSYDFEAAWLTIDVHSSLAAVGLTAAFSTALTDQAIPCNVLAGFYHDHLLVPVERATDAVSCLAALAD